MKLTWLGHSCFKVEKDGFAVILDPYRDGSVPGLKNVRETADMVLCSHEHGDHNGRECVTVTGRTDAPFSVSQIRTFHDDTCGSQRGDSVITIMDDGDVRIAHFGDLGCDLTGEQEEMLKNLDVALIPVGGFYTIDGKKAGEIIKKIHPEKVVPMHYRDPGKGFGFAEISTADEFLQTMDSVVKTDTSVLDTEKDYGAQVIVLCPRNAETGKI